MKKKDKIIAVVGARGGSKGVPKKNILLLNNKPLITYVLNTLLKVRSIDRIIVSTDSFDIKKVVKNFNNEIEVRDRNKKLALDNTPLTSVAKSVANELFFEGYKPDIILQVAPTCPFTSVKTVINIINNLVKKKTDCSVTLKKIEHEHPYRAKILSQKNNIFRSFIKNIHVEKFISRQDLPTLYCTSGAIYARRFDLLKKFEEKDFCLGKKPLGVIVDDIESVNIDRLIDFYFAEYLIKTKHFVYE